jgi:protein gp37
MAGRLKAMGQKRYSNGFELTVHDDVFYQPLTWKKPQVIFVNSMSDLFHEDVPDSVIMEIFQVMNKTPQHTYQILTKRSDRLLNLSPDLNWTSNIWMGVSIESQRYLKRIHDLQRTHAKLKFLSIEPLIGPIARLNLDKLDWVVVGGESGPNARPMRKEWVDCIKDICILDRVPFFFKQWGGKNKHRTGRLLDGKTWDEMPNLVTG